MDNLITTVLMRCDAVVRVQVPSTVDVVSAIVDGTQVVSGRYVNPDNAECVSIKALEVIDAESPVAFDDVADFSKKLECHLLPDAPPILIESQKPVFMLVTELVNESGEKESRLEYFGNLSDLMSQLNTVWQDCFENMKNTGKVSAFFCQNGAENLIIEKKSFFFKWSVAILDSDSDCNSFSDIRKNALLYQTGMEESEARQSFLKLRNLRSNLKTLLFCQGMNIEKVIK